MRLDPVYLVAPEPTSSRPHRRAFLARTAFLAGGFLLGGGLGFWIGNLRTGPLPPAQATDSQRLAWAMGLQSGPIAQFAVDHADYLVVFDLEIHARDRFWPGFRRLVSAILEDDVEVRAVRRDVARLVAQTLEYCEPPADLARLVPALRRVAR